MQSSWVNYVSLTKERVLTVIRKEIQWDERKCIDYCVIFFRCFGNISHDFMEKKHARLGVHFFSEVGGEGRWQWVGPLLALSRGSWGKAQGMDGGTMVGPGGAIRGAR